MTTSKSLFWNMHLEVGGDTGKKPRTASGYPISLNGSNSVCIKAGEVFISYINLNGHSVTPLLPFPLTNSIRWWQSGFRRGHPSVGTGRVTKDWNRIILRKTFCSHKLNTCFLYVKKKNSLLQTKQNKKRPDTGSACL